MAIDNTPPRLKLIVTIAILTVTTLVFLDFALKSYYGYMSDEAIREKLAPPIDLEEQHKAEGAALAKANVDGVMAQMGKGPRAEIITPQQSEDLGPMTGWTKMPHPAPTPQPHVAVAPETADAGATDAGVVAVGKDGGAPPRTVDKVDGGAKH